MKSQRHVNWWNAAGAAASGALLGMMQSAAQGAATALQSGETDYHKIGKAALIGSLIAFAGWAFPTFKAPTSPAPPGPGTDGEPKP